MIGSVTAGKCVDGKCECIPILNPYNRYLPFILRWAPFGPEERKMVEYEGMDCSYVTPFAAGSALRPALTVWAVAMLLERILRHWLHADVGG